MSSYTAYAARFFPSPDNLIHGIRADGARYLALPPVTWGIMLAAAFGTVLLGLNFGVIFCGFGQPISTIVVFLGASVALARYPAPLMGRIRILLEAVAFLTAGAMLGRYLAYELQIFGSPLQDAKFAWLDSSLGFDYVAQMMALDTHPLFCRILHATYYSFRYQIAGTVLAFAVVGYQRALAHLLLALFLSLCFCAFISAIFPAVGAVTQIDSNMAFRYLTFDGATPVAHLDALRDGMRDLNLPDLGGIITFPSFHVVMAVLVTYAWRSIRILIVPVFLLNVLMSVSAMSQGGHYLIDCLAGIAIAVTAIVVAYALIGWRHGSLAAPSKGRLTNPVSDSGSP